MLLRWITHICSPMDFIIFIILFTTCHIITVSGHGRLIDPPSRSSMWRFGFKTKKNYNDNELFCGGYTIQWQRNGGKCGICGDAYHLPQPRPNEAGGVYGRGIIVKKYKAGEVINSRVEITANHKGFFEFKMCPQNNPKVVATQECLDQYPLEMAEGLGTKYYVKPGTGPVDVQLRLPSHLTCSQCVFQWTYTAGNNWGTSKNGTSCVGCGSQETFRGCADVAISGYRGFDDAAPPKRPQNARPSISNIPKQETPPPRPQPRPPRPTRPRRPSRKPFTPPSRRPVYTRKPPTKPSTAYNYPRRRYSTTKTTTTRYPRSRPTPVWNNRPYTKAPSTKKPRLTHKPKPTTKKPVMQSGGNYCVAVGVWKNVSGMASWCDLNCARGYCPSTHCSCKKK